MNIVYSGEKQRLDKFLTGQWPEKSRSRIQKIIKNGMVLVNGKPTAVHFFLKEGDKIEILKNMNPTPRQAEGYRGGFFTQSVRSADGFISICPHPRRKRRGIRAPIIKEVSKSRIVNTQHLNRPKSEKAKIAANLIPKIIFEDDDVIVLDKPPGLLVHPRQNEKDGGEPTLVDWLIEKYPQIKNVGDVEAARRPGIVHRLDKETSGLMVAAKTPAAFDHLKKQFHDRLVKKEYLAAAYGKIKSDVGRIELAIGRSTIGGKMAARAKGEEGKPAMTEFEVLERGSKSTLVKIFAKTGRTHQIRVHFFALGHPLVGDPLYQSKKYKKIPGERLMLHARKLAFQGLDGEEKTFTAPLPPEFKIFASF